MADKMEKIAPIPSVQFSSKSNGYKLRSVGFEVSFYCHDNVFRRDSKKIEINSYL